MIYGPGLLDCGMSLDYGQLVLDNEVIKLFRNTVEGIPVNDYTLATDVIKSVGPRGHFMMEQHTIENMKAQSDPKFFHRGDRESWIAAGQPKPKELATEKARQILAEHKPLPLPKGVEEKMADIIKEAEKRYCKNSSSLAKAMKKN